MAHNLGITEGSGKLLATEEITKDGQLTHVQYIVIKNGVTGSLSVMKVNTDGSLNVNPIGLAGTINNGHVALTKGGVAGAPTAVPATPLSNRNAFEVYNAGDVFVWHGKSDVHFPGQAGATDSNLGFPLPPGQSRSIDASTTVYFIAATGGTGGTVDVYYWEQA